ncbi:MAG TPA: type I DNA topoisomerase [Gemmatimonadaceae bacterium]|nr:type I DNA topoisomerase [Gemmatimonadaceae bacterium]
MAQKRKTTTTARKRGGSKRSAAPARTSVKASAPRRSTSAGASGASAAPRGGTRSRSSAAGTRSAGGAGTLTRSRTGTSRKKTGRGTATRGNSGRARSLKAAGNGDNGSNGSVAGKSLVIVESPAKARTIGKYLGPDYRVRATIGHVRDLPPKGLGIDVEKGFTPRYVPVEGKEKTLAELKSAAREASRIFLATDPDREGEAIAWHVAESIQQRGIAPIRRVLFHEITRDAVQRAIRNAGDIDQKKVEAQQARRVLDRLVGYKTSPLLWKTIKKGLSAGRVQTVALRLIVEREREIRAFKPVEYWTIQALMEKAGQSFISRLHQIDGKKPEIHNEREASGILADLKGKKTFQVTDVRRRERRKNSSAPFTTSTLQQEGAKRLGFGSKKTMKVAQGLYEGIDLGAEGAVGLITYMRTDSTRVAESAAQQAQDYIATLFGKQFLAPGLQLYGGGKNKANTQDAHEAIRPTDPTRRPEHVRKFLSADQYKLYELIWKRFMASQMAPAVFDTTTVDFDLGRYLFRATGSVVKFEGFLVLYREAHEEGEGKALEDEQALPVLEKNENVPVKEIVPRQHFTEPPPRFSEASLVKELERLGIGRPSTYASIISTLADRHYVTLEQRRFTPTELGETVEKIMVRQFPDIFNVTFTSTMEQDLDRVEEGEATWREVLEEFYTPFSAALGKVDVHELIAQAHDLSVLETERCPECGSKLKAHGGIFGPYLACERRPECKFTRRLGAHRKPAIPTDEKCHECGAPMVIRHGRTGEFLGCSRFPKCRGTRALPTGIKCPKDGGDIIQLRSKRGGRAFYGCGNHPDCDFVCWNRPVKEPCPECGFEGAEARSTKARGEFRRCLKCGNEWDVAAPAEAVAAG